MHSVIETDTFKQEADRLLSEDERLAVILAISANPKIGDLIPGTGGARKARFPGRGKGKSGGYRVITYYAADDVPVFLLDLLSKGERVDLSMAERNELRGLLGKLAGAWRSSARARISGGIGSAT